MKTCIKQYKEKIKQGDSAGILDTSTLGKIDIKGTDASEFLNRVYTNAWSKLAIGKCGYGLMLNEDGWFTMTVLLQGLVKIII